MHFHKDNHSGGRGFFGHFGRHHDGARREGGRFGMGFDHDGDRPQRGGGGGRRRMFDGGELRLVLLKLIGDQPRHGYDLIRAIEERTGGAYAPSPGVVYPTVTLLADMGLIEEQAATGARKLFAITADGIAHLAEHAAEVEAILARLDALAAMRDRTEVVPIRRAMHNLRSILEHKLVAGLDKDVLHAAVALIDEAAGKIERL